MQTNKDIATILIDIVQDLVQVVDKEGNVSNINLKKNTRKKKYIYSRAMCYKILRDLGWSLEHIGSYFGKDHATVRHALIGFEYMMKDDKHLACLYPEIRFAFERELAEAKDRAKAEEVISLKEAKIKIAELEQELFKLRLVEKDYLREVGKTAVVYNKFRKKLVLL